MYAIVAVVAGSRPLIIVDHRKWYETFAQACAARDSHLIAEQRLAADLGVTAYRIMIADATDVLIA